MKRRNEKKHVIDFLFPLAVFLCWRHHRSPLWFLHRDFTAGR